MRVLTSIGEIGLEVGERAIILRPTLAAMESLGSGKEIVEILRDVFTPPPAIPTNAIMVPWFKAARAAHWRRVHWASYQVIVACASEDITDLMGTMGERYGTFKPGRIPFAGWQPMAASLLHHGIIGKVPQQTVDRSDPNNKTGEFRPAEFVSQAIVHLGMAEDAAWNMTVTSFLMAMRAKFGKPEAKMPPSKEYDDMMDYLDKVNALRDKGKKA